MSEKSRSELALFFIEKFQPYLLPPGLPFNDQTMALVVRSAFLLVNTFRQMEGMSQEELLAVGVPKAPPQMKVVPPAEQAS